MSLKKIKSRALLEEHFDTSTMSAESSTLFKIFSGRGVSHEQAEKILRGEAYGLVNLLAPADLYGIDDGVELLSSAIHLKQKILLVGDFDADGATSTALAILALKAMGHENVEYLVPNRFEFGYGLTPEIVQVAAEKNPKLIVTVDNGISSTEGVAYAKSLGISVLVTDHHLAGETLPKADAIVNPNQPACSFGSKNLAGVGVIFYVLCHLRSALKNTGYFTKNNIAAPNMAQFLDLVALGTVADVVPLDFNNRILVFQGIARIQQHATRPGITALLQIAGRSPEHISADDFGFAIGPRLNAAGRLDDMSLGIECLLENSMNRALQYARELDNLNRDRRSIERGMQQDAQFLLDKMTRGKISSKDDQNFFGISVYQSDWHQGVIGILASRIKEQYFRPVIAFAKVSEETIKGSARSIPGVHIRDILDAIAKKAPKLLDKFGGHAMAAGLQIRVKDFEEFSQRFNQEVAALLQYIPPAEQILVDGRLHQSLFNQSFAHRLQEVGPWGQRFEVPMFEGDFYICDQRLVGDKHLKLKLSPDKQGSEQIDAIAFNIDPKLWPNVSCAFIRCVYTLEINRFRNIESLQLNLRHLEPHNEAHKKVVETSRSNVA